MNTYDLKRRLSCLLAGMMLFGLSACGQKASPQTSPPTQNPNTTEPSGSAPADASEAEPSEEPTIKGQGGALVIYFSTTGNTKAVAEAIAEAADGDLYEITPKEPYTADDLNWRNESSRVNVEHSDPDSRPALAGELPDLSGYDTVFIGYPSWWGEAPNIVRTLMEAVDFSGKTMIPFCTSSSSGLGSSGETLAALTSGATWLEGQRFRGGVEATEVADWVNGLEYSEEKTS